MIEPLDLPTVTRLYDAYMRWRLHALAWLTAQQQEEPRWNASASTGTDAA